MILQKVADDTLDDKHLFDYCTANSLLPYNTTQDSEAIEDTIKANTSVPTEATPAKVAGASTRSKSRNKTPRITTSPTKTSAKKNKNPVKVCTIVIIDIIL